MIDDEDLISGFLEEAREHLEMIEPALLDLESDPTDMDIINRLFRSVHSIKGGAGFFGMDKMNTLAHAMENLMSKARNSKIVIRKEHADALLLGLDRLNLMVADIDHIEDLDIGHEVELLESLGLEGESGIDVQPKPDLPVERPADSGGEIGRIRFDISQSDIDKAVSEGMNIYAVSVLMNRDLMQKDKTPYQFISELEELGWFIDSYLDTDPNGSLGEVPEGELQYVFIFATIMESDITAQALEVGPDRLAAFDMKKHAGDKAVVREYEVVAGEKEPWVSDTEDSKKTVPGDSTVAPSPSEAEPITKDEKKQEVKRTKSEESIRVSINKLSKLVDLAGELVLVRNRLLQVGEREGKKIPEFMGILQNLNMVTTGLQEEILNTRMQSISTVFGKFPRLMRELGKKLGKDIALVTEGNEVELDKTVLEALSDPLTHIVRNTADHGIEMPEERAKAGKSLQGELLLKAYHESGRVIILVKDDGKGIDADRIAAKALEKGLVDKNDLSSLNQQDRVNLIFLPGFSMADQISSVSGRGVGMDVVRSNIEGIGGSVELNSILGEGTTIKMTLPLTMAIVSSLIVQSGDQRFAIPQINLEELVIVKPDEYQAMLDHVQEREVLKIRGELLPLISLAKGLGIPEKNGESAKRLASPMVDSLPNDEGPVLEKDSENGLVEKADNNQEVMRILIVSVGNNKIGITVDSILGTEEIVVKPMPEYLSQIASFSGATILGDGTVAMILDTIGFVQENHMSILEKKVGTFIMEEEKKSYEEQQSILIFDNGTEEQFAVTISLIQRVDTISLDQLQCVGDKEYIEYRGQQIRILRLADYLPIKKPSYDSEFFSIIFPKETKIPVAILIHKVVDTQTLKISLSDASIRTRGIHGSTLIDGKITLLLDLYTLLELGEPESIHQVKIEEQKLSNVRILLVEDTPLFLAVIREYLESAGLEVVSAINGKRALQLMENETVDLVLSDIEMPEMDGWGLIRAIRADDQLKDLPVIALTSIDDEEAIKIGLQAGFNDWIIKLDKHKILSCINSHL
ncbi:MAG: hybrid sensor histidine kinase/response regulator [Proteobacteria bacterium]|nr:hybrid sensor histidine kinase/response regulator [Pseudomonadota bacterium]